MNKIFFEKFEVEGKDLKTCFLSQDSVYIEFVTSVFHNDNYQEMYHFIPINQVLDWIDEMQSKER